MKKNGDWMGTKELSEITHIGRGSLATNLTKLIKQGLIEVKTSHFPPLNHLENRYRIKKSPPPNQ